MLVSRLGCEGLGRFAKLELGLFLWFGLSARGRERESKKHQATGIGMWIVL